LTLVALELSLSGQSAAIVKATTTDRRDTGYKLPDKSTLVRLLGTTFLILGQLAAILGLPTFAAAQAPTPPAQVQAKPSVKSATAQNSQAVTARAGGTPVWHDFTVNGQAISIANEGSVIWVGTFPNNNNGQPIAGTGGLSKLDAATGNVLASYTTANSGLLDDTIHAIAIDSAGNKWLATNGGVSEFNGTTWITYTMFNSGLVSNGVDLIAIDKAGNKWFGTPYGLSEFNGTTWTTYTSSNSGLSYNQVVGLGTDSSGAVWVGSYDLNASNCYPRGAVNKFDGTTWTNYAFDSNFPTTLTVDSQNNVWVGINSSLNNGCSPGSANQKGIISKSMVGRVAKFDGSTWHSFSPQASPALASVVSTIFADKVGNIWVGGDQGVAKYDGTNWQSYSDPAAKNSSDPAFAIHVITEDGAGHKWFSASSVVSEFDDSGAGLGANLTGLNFNYQTGGSAPAAQSISLSAYNFPVTWTTTISYVVGISNWLNISQSSGTTSLTTPSSITVNVSNNTLMTGIYTAILTIKDTTNSSNQVAINIVLRVGYVYYLPDSISQNYDATSFSHTTLQNTSSSQTATVFMEYYDPSGAAIAVANNACATIAPLAECIPGPAKQNYTINDVAHIVTSSQPLTIVGVEPIFPSMAWAHIPTPAPASSLIVPLVLNDAFGSYRTYFSIFNASAGVVTATVKFYDHTGALLDNATQYLTIPPYALDTNIGYGLPILLYMGGGAELPDGFYGWAQIDGIAGSQLVATVHEINSNFRTTFNAQSTIASTVYAPTVFNLAFGGYNTGASIVNPNSNPVDLTITYYDQTGKALPPATLTLAAHALATIYHGNSQGSAGGNGIPAGGLPIGFYGSAKVTSSGGGVVMLANEVGPSSVDASGDTIQSTSNGTYLAVPAGSARISLPIMAKDGYGFTTGSTILNVSNASVGVTVQYYNLDGTPVANGASSYTIAANGSQPVYQGAEMHLPDGFYGTAIVTQTSGPASSLVVTTNAISSTTFYTYTEPGL
jgi:hypothetical protein